MKKIGKGIVIFPMIIITAVAQILTLLKSSMVAGLFGASNTMDAYNFANSIATFLFGFISAGISSIIIPEYGKKKDIKTVNTFITILYLAIGVLIALMSLFRYQLIGLMSGKGTDFIDIAANSLVILLLSQLMASVSSITVAYFQCEEKYLTPKVIHLVSQIIVVVVLFFAKNLSIMEYALIVAAGVVFNFVVDTSFAVKAGWRFQPTFHFSDETKTLFKCFFPIVFSTGLYNLSQLVDSLLATFLQTGGITILSYSSQVSMIVNTVITGNLLTYIYPKTVKNIKIKAPQSLFWNNTILCHMICCLMISGFFAVGKDGVVLLLNHGKFTYDQCTQVFIGALIYIFGQQTNCVRSMIYQYFYAVGNTSTPARNSVLVTVLNLVFSFALVYFIGFYGIIIGTILASLCSVVMIFIKFGKKIGFESSFASILKRFLLNLGIAIVTMILVWVSQLLLPIDNILLRILVFGMETVLFYCGMQWIFNRKKIVVTLKML